MDRASSLSAAVALIVFSLPQIGCIAFGQACRNGGTCVESAPPNCKIDPSEPHIYHVFGCAAGVEAHWDPERKDRDKQLPC